MSSKKVCVGVILSAHGIKGLVKIKSFTKDPRSLALYKKIFNSDNSQQFTIEIKSAQQDILLASISVIAQVPNLRHRHPRESGDPGFNAVVKEVLDSRFRGNDKSTEADFRLEHVTDRTQAEALVRTKLYVDRAEFAPTDKDEFYISDLIGMDVVDHSSRHVGKIVHVHNFGAGDIVEIQLKGSVDTKMVSFNAINFGDIDLAKGVIIANSKLMS